MKVIINGKNVNQQDVIPTPLKLTRISNCNEYSFIQQCGKIEFINCLKQILLFLLSELYNENIYYRDELVVNESINVYMLKEKHLFKYTILNLHIFLLYH